ncbi:amino acid ABC transporter permease [Eubacteriales bacterium OttesenSCG-928-K08]|nr:amino acid ABC transporter permease [Eubacteriales bacterium OttesenSCG-928-K08]
MTTWDWIERFLQLYWPQFLKGAGWTLLLAIIGTVGGFVIGLLIGVVRTTPLYSGGQKRRSLRSVLLKIVNAILAVYIEVLRGTPMMVQAVLVFYGLMEFAGIDITSSAAGMLVITLNTGAYMAEIVRGGIQSVDPGQTEASKAIGMTHWQTMLNVVLPQTIRNILPATGNEFIVNLKDSSVLSVIMVSELFYSTQVIKSIYYRTYEPFLIAATIYLFFTFTSSRLLRLLEKRMDGPSNYTLISSATTPELLKQNRRYQAGATRRR